MGSMTDSDLNSSTRTVYDSSAAVYVEAVGTRISPDFETPTDRAVLHAFAETVQARVSNGTGPNAVLDAGCGVGRATVFLAECGLAVSGVDLSPGMIAQARKAHPGLRFAVASLTNLKIADHSLAAVCCWYSIIHTPLEGLPSIWAELDRVLAPEGDVLIGFQSGSDDRIERPNAHGTATTLTSYLHGTDSVAASLEEAGFEIRSTTVREPELAHENTRQSSLLARKVSP